MERRHEIDYLRSVLVLGMVAFHAMLALHLEGLARIPFGDLRLELALTLVQIGFIGSAGVTRGLRAARPLRKEGLQILKLAGASGLISLISYIIFPEFWVFFGVLHFYSIATLFSFFFVKLKKWNLIGGILWLLFGWMNPNLIPDGSLFWQIIGISETNFSSLDFFPLFPWFGVYLLGMGLAPLWSRKASFLRPTWFSKIGAYTFWIYMLHLPLVFLFAKIYGKLIEVL